jgi:uncharacterized protein involved in outer membrane biogenesis
MQGKDVGALEQIIGGPLPIKGPFAVSGKVTDPASRNYEVSDLTLALGKNRITGQLNVHLADQEVRVATELSAQGINLRPVSISELESLTNLADLGPLRFSANFVSSANKLAVKDLQVNLGNKELAEVMLKGTIENLLIQRGLTLDFTVQGKDMANLKELVGEDLPLQGSFKASGQLVDPAPGIYKLPSLNVALGENDISGWMELDFTKERPYMLGELSSERFDFRPLLADYGKNGTVKGQPEESGKSADRVFSNKPWSFEAMNRADADIKIRDKQILFRNLAVDELQLHLQLKKGELEIQPIQFAVGGGSARGQFHLNSRNKNPALSLEMKLNQVDPGQMLDDLGYERALEGILNADVRITGHGNSTAEFMGGLNGGLYLWMKDGKASSKYLSLLQKYLGTDVLRLLNPFKSKDPYGEVNCLVNRVEISDGLADCKLLLDTPQTSVLAAGDINLESEKLNLGIKPTPKKGSGISGAGKISFSFKELSQPFRLGGTLAKPSLAVDPTRTAFMIGKLGGALLLGPLGIAAFFSDVSLGKKDLCASALRNIEEKTGMIESQKKR